MNAPSLPRLSSGGVLAATSSGAALLLSRTARAPTVTPIEAIAGDAVESKQPEKLPIAATTEDSEPAPPVSKRRAKRETSRVDHDPPLDLSF